jgi:DNA-binding XRE family transcriptional regulator
MDKKDLTIKVSEKLKLIRTEYNYSQDKMAEIIGLSKKTLVQIEKERQLLSWIATCAVCAIFRESEILKMTIGDDPIEILEVVAHNTMINPKNPTFGGKIWLENIKNNNKFIIQQNIVSGHYRIIDTNNKRWYSSFDKEEILKKFEELM